MKIDRKFTVAGRDPFETVEWVTRSSRIVNPDGSVVFETDNVEAPKAWSQLATDIMVSKYFRKAGVPQEDGGTGPETSARQVIHRLAGCWRHWGERHNYFDAPEDAQAYYDEMVYMLLHQIAAPNSPQWFNTGLNWAYGITGPAQGHTYVDPSSGQVKQCEDTYSRPQPHACFIQSIRDDLVNSGGIMDLWLREARLFKYGSGTGTNFSKLRAEDEPLSGGGKSSGLMSWLRIGDRAAGAIKSGGTTRRAAKMVCLDLDHPDIERFINWKVREELKVAAMVEGIKHLKDEHKQTAQRLGLKLDYDFNGEAYQTVSGQNSNNSIRIADEFFDAVDQDNGWKLYDRTDGRVAKELSASKLWEDICFATWRCADPGVQYDTTINAWHTCPASGRINASNPCSEYMFLDNTACNLASINLIKLYDPETRTFDVDRFEHAIDLWTLTLEISVLMASFPSEEIARLSYEYRTLGLGYANLGALLMQAGAPYDSEEGRAICGMVSAVLTGRSYRQSAAMAAELGPFAGYRDNADHMLRVIRNHRRAAHGVLRDATGDEAYEQLRIPPVPIDQALARSGRLGVANAAELLERATRAWDEALTMGQLHGFRNAQVTVIAPTGTIGLLMDCDTTGVEPDFALVKFKKLAGGGYFKIANGSLRPALRTLGYDDEQIREILTYVLGALRLDAPLPDKNGHTQDAGQTLAEFLRGKGLVDEDLSRIEDALPGVFELSFALGAWSLGDEALQRLGFDPDRCKQTANFDLLRELGLTAKQIEALNDVICGVQTIEGAPHLRDEHLEIFDCASKCGRKGRRFIAVEGHIRMMASAQPFISGAISKTINLPKESTVEDFKSAYRLSWELGLKANALYRDGCKLSQPLSSKSDAQSDAEHEAEDERGVDDASLRMLNTEEKAEQDEAAAVEPAASHHAQSAVESNLERELATASQRGQVEDEREGAAGELKRHRLPDTRRSITHKFNVAGHEGYLTVGLYEQGGPGELFITMAKEGSTIGGLMDSLGTAVSVALQYGVPIESLVRKFTHQRFEPAGMTANPDIPFAKSIVDYIFRWLGMQFIDGFREANAPVREQPEIEQTVAPESDERGGDVNGGGAAAGATAQGGPVVVTRQAPKSENPLRRVTSARASAAHGGAGSASPTPQMSSTLSRAMRDCQGDAPACEVCGEITVRNGTCYRCLNCGHSMGCS